jgi:hypothetical protein
MFTTVLHSVKMGTLHHLMAYNAEIIMHQLNWRNRQRFNSGAVGT